MRNQTIIILGLVTGLGLSGCADSPKKNQVSDSHSQQNNGSEVDLDKAAQLNVNLGLAYLKQGQTSRAKTKLNRAMKLAPQLPEVHYGMAFYLEQVGDMDEARKAYKKAIA